MPTDSIPSFLGWAASSAGLAAIAAFLIERLGAFQALSSKQKQIIVACIIVVIPQAVLFLIGIVPAATWATLQPYWQSLVTSVVVLVTLLSSEVAHRVDKVVRKEL